MASGHVNRITRPDTWLHRPMLQNVKKVLANPEPSTHGTKRTYRVRNVMSASLIGRLGSSAFRLSTTTVSMSLTGSCFSSESAPRPFQYGIRRRGGTIFRAALPSVDGRTKQTCELTSSIVPRGTSFHGLVEFECSPIAFGYLRPSCYCGLSGPPELGAVNPDAVLDHGQPARQRNDRLLHPAVPGDLHRPGLEP